MKTLNVNDLLRTREMQLQNDRIAQCSDHLWRATRDLTYAVMKYNRETDSNIMVNELKELCDIRTKLLGLVEDIETTINAPF